MLNRLHLDSIIESEDKYNGKKVSDIINGNKSVLFKLIKKGYDFDEDVLSSCKITRTIRDVRYENVIVEHEKMTEPTKITEEQKNEPSNDSLEFEFPEEEYETETIL